MNRNDEEQIRSMLHALTEVSYAALMEVKQLKGEPDEDLEKNLLSHRENLLTRIEELFTKD